MSALTRSTTSPWLLWASVDSLYKSFAWTKGQTWLKTLEKSSGWDCHNFKAVYVYLTLGNFSRIRHNNSPSFLPPVSWTNTMFLSCSVTSERLTSFTCQKLRLIEKYKSILNVILLILNRFLSFKNFLKAEDIGYNTYFNNFSQKTNLFWYIFKNVRNSNLNWKKTFLFFKNAKKWNWVFYA